MVTADIADEVHDGNPVLFNDIWSTGWCKI